MKESKTMLRPGLSLLLLLVTGSLFAAPPAPAPSSPNVSAPPRPEITTDNTRQIVVSGGTLQTRITFMHAAAELRTSVLAGLNQPSYRYPTARPILLFLNSAVRKTAVPQLEVIEDPGGLKVQVNLNPELDTKSILFERTVIQALLLELAFRSRTHSSSGSIPATPRWLVDALLHKFHYPNLFFAVDSLQPILDSGQIPSLSKILLRAEMDPIPSSTQDESIARCLLALLTGQPESRSAITSLLCQPSDEASGISTILRRFPSLGSSEADLQRQWTLHLAALGTQRERIILTGAQTLKELNHLLELDLTDQNGTRSAYGIEQFSDYLRLEGIRSILASRHLELLGLLGRGHFYYSEAIKAYAQVCQDLSLGKTAGQASQLKKAAQFRDQATAQLERVRDYLNWFEAEKSPNRSTRMEEIYRMWDESEPATKNPVVSKALEELEERLKKQQEMAEIERALRESRARSKDQR